MGKSMSLNKISIYIETNTKIEYRKYTIYKATLYLKTILLKNVFLKRSLWMAGIAGDLFLKLYLISYISQFLFLVFKTAYDRWGHNGTSVYIGQFWWIT